ncbi:uncharacterized protein LOC122513217 [Polistes fuscatus]|uniref:uncharacterized protein LOC122513217 n=1 Tax=Polistes fuscatus TaxID=30207 RepID=UPI001CA862F5|nr:uncharacterized protein LOC122513217 [Polistes fuscatus]
MESTELSTISKTIFKKHSFQIEANYILHVLCRVLGDNAIRLLNYRYKQCNIEYSTLSNLYLCTFKFDNKRWGSYEYHGEFIVKAEPSGRPMALQIYKQEKLFETEMFMYLIALEKIYRLTHIRFGPKLIYCSNNTKTLIMDSLNFHGYRMMDRRKALPKDYCNLVIRKLAIFHAASVAVCEKNPEWPTMLHGGILANASDSFLRLCENSIYNISREIRTWGQEYSVTADKIEKFVGQIRTKGKQIFDYDFDEFCVINHGDLCTNNIMFYHGFREDLPCDVLFVDFQRSCYTSPVIDLIHFFNTSLEINFKYKREYHFLSQYLNVLTYAMAAFRCNTRPPTLAEIEKAMKKRRLYIIIVGLVLYPRMVVRRKNRESLEHVLGTLNGDTELDVFKEPLAVESIRTFIKFMELKGFISPPPPSPPPPPPQPQPVPVPSERQQQQQQ